MKKLILVIILVINASLVFAGPLTKTKPKTKPKPNEPVSVTLNEYAFDFMKIGSHIVFVGNSSFFLTPESDVFKVSFNGYTIKVKPSKLSRNGRKDFTSYYNSKCNMIDNENQFQRNNCIMVIHGEVEVDNEFRMIVLAKGITFTDITLTKNLGTFK